MLFKIKTTQSRDNQLLKKASSLAERIVLIGGNNKGGGISQKIAAACAVVDAKLGALKERYDIIIDPDRLREYLIKAKENGILAIDTETGGLDPLSDKIAGICLYTPKMKGVYIPVNHYSYVTGQRVDAQMKPEDASQLLNEIKVAKNIFHNAKFDIRFLRNQLQVEIEPYWDTSIAAKLLNENEPTHSLKPLHKKYVNPNIEDYKFDSFFEGVQFNFVPIKSGYVYAARDAEITYELYEYQRQYLTREELPLIFDLFHQCEMPLINVVSKMEDAGIELDFDLAANLKEKYEAELIKVEQDFIDSLAKYKENIKKYRQNFRTGKECKLGDPINIGSPTQIAILLYDIIQLKNPDKRAPRGTGEDILLLLTDQLPELKILLKYREIKKLLSTYILKMPDVAGKDGRIHCSFNQIGTVTGRFSSTEPNMQNIPSHNKDIRKMFKAAEGKVLISCDYSQQEPRVLAHLSGDDRLIQSYKDGRDIYAQIASICFHKNYEDCKEFFPDGKLNKEGKRLRTIMKAIVLGIMYGKEPYSIATDLGITRKNAEETYNSFFRLFPKVRDFMVATQEQARTCGYVTTMGGRKRRLPDMQLEQFDMKVVEDKSGNSDPLDFESTEKQRELTIDPEVREELERQLRRCRYYQEKAQVYERAESQYGIKITDNTYKISDATRQCVNSVIQGSSADMVKRAMLAISKDSKLSKLGFQLLLSVHDELIGECPESNAAQCAELMSENMIAVSGLSVPMKCDTEITKCWYGEQWEKGN